MGNLEFSVNLTCMPLQMNHNKLPSRAADPRVISRGPDFTPAFADFGRQMTGARGAMVSRINNRTKSYGAQ